MDKKPNIPYAVPKASSDPLPEIFAFLEPFAPLFGRSPRYPRCRPHVLQNVSGVGVLSSSLIPFVNLRRVLSATV
jgi:hypothetical protein